MATTMSLIAKQTVGSSGAATITFSNIPQTFTDLKLVASVRTSQSSTQVNPLISFNGSSSNFSYRFMTGNGSSASSSSGSSNPINDVNAANSTANTFSNFEIYIPNYTGSNYKSFGIDSAQETNATTAYEELWAMLWSNTAAITSLTLDSGANFVEFSTIYLYGISSSSTQNTSVPLASGGDVITTDGTYWYHAFKYSGVFTPLKDLSADLLVVAGGGGGGDLGGGGAGGVLAFASQSLTVGTASTCTIGAGGTGVTGGDGVNGGNSQFASLTAGVGGGGGVGYAQGKSGGSGGGTGRVIAYIGTGTAGQGNNGGYSTNTGDVRTAGGGGGAGGVGGNATQTSWASGAGGAGTNSVTNWGALSSMLTATSLGVSGYIAGGGGGGGDDVAGTWGAGGSGGGGDGGSSGHTATAGVANTGSGGGGVGVRTNSSKNGGAGLIVVRYAV